jgi:hypothetical protein
MLSLPEGKKLRLDPCLGGFPNELSGAGLPTGHPKWNLQEPLIVREREFA